MTIRDELKAFLSEKPFSNPLTEEGLDKLAGWVEEYHKDEVYYCPHCFRMVHGIKPHYDLAAKLKRLVDAECIFNWTNDSPWIGAPDGAWGTEGIEDLPDIPVIIDAAIAELDKREAEV